MCPASPPNLQHILSSLPTRLPESISTSSRPSARPPGKAPGYCEDTIQPFSPMGLNLSQAGSPGSPTTCSSAQGHQRTWWPWTARPCPAQGSLPPHTCARSLKVCCSPSPSSASGATCSWSCRDSWSDVEEARKGWSGSVPSSESHWSPSLVPTHHIASKAMAIVQPLGNLTAAPSALNRVGPEKCGVPPPVSLLGKSWSQNRAWPHTEG